MKSSKKGLSGIIATILLIALAIAIVSVVWVVVSNLVSEQLEEAGTCLDAIGSVEIDKSHTCYDSSTEELEFSIIVGDVELEKLSVSIVGAGLTKSYEIGKEAVDGSPLTYYDGASDVILPNKNEGFVYKLNTTAAGIGVPESIRISPTIGGQQCGETDNLQEINSCLF